MIQVEVGGEHWEAPVNHIRANTKAASPAHTNGPSCFHIPDNQPAGNGDKTVWPSGLRRWLKAPVRKGVGSNPTAVISQCHVCYVLLDCHDHAVRHGDLQTFYNNVFATQSGSKSIG